jgi:hypothetical protein
MVEHTGGIDGFNADLAYYPDDKVTIVVLRNINLPSGQMAAITNKLAAACFGEPVE